MVTIEKIKKLYINLGNEELTTSVLKECGFNSYDITKLIQKNILEREKRGYYKLKISCKELEEVLGIKVNENPLNEKLIHALNDSVSKLSDDNVMVLFKLKDKAMIDKIKDYLKPNMCVKVLVFEEKESGCEIALKKQNSFDPEIDVRQSIKYATRAYYGGNYNTAIEMFNYLVALLKHPSSYILKMLGFSYSRINKTKEAIKYLNVAQGISKQEGYIEDFSNAINKLRNQNIKPVSYNSKKEINFANINNIKEIAFAIYRNHGNIDLACQEFELSLEQTLLIKIVVARVYYQDGNNIVGDLLLKQVERTKGKSEKVKFFFEETRKNKAFYKHREDEEGKKLAVILQNKQIVE